MQRRASLGRLLYLPGAKDPKKQSNEYCMTSLTFVQGLSKVEEMEYSIGQLTQRFLVLESFVSISND